MSRVGFALSHEQFTPSELVELGIEAERQGFDAVWTSDHFHPWMDRQGHAGQAWVTLAALGQRVALPLGTAVTCPTFRYNPAVVAQAFASLGSLYPGRVFLGVGAGEAVNEQPVTGRWAPVAERHDRLVEAVEIIRRLWAGEWLTYQGMYYRVTDAHLYTLPPSPVPLYIAAEGPEAARLAGRYGDGLITDARSATEPKIREAFQAGAREAGKDPATMPVLAELFVATTDRPGAADAARVWRFLPHSWDRFVDVSDPRQIGDEAAERIPIEDVLATMTVGEDPEVHIRKLRDLFDAGVTEVYVHSGEANQRRVLAWYGEKVLPHVRVGQAVSR